MPRTDSVPARGQCHIDRLGDQHGRVSLGEQHRAARFEGLRHPRPRDIHALARIRLLRLRQAAERALRQRQRRLTAEMLGLRDRERIEIGGRRKRLLGLRRGGGQCLLAQRCVLDSIVVVGHDRSSLPWGSVRGSAVLPTLIAPGRIVLQRVRVP